MEHLSHLIIHAIEHTLEHSLGLIPFLFLTYLVMEFIEHRAGDHAVKLVQKAGRFGPVIGAVAGAVPQCGFSAAASNLYAGRVITLGTLMAIFLSTSDEMLPILLSNQVDFLVILKLLGIKIIIGLIAGLAIDALIHPSKDHDHEHIHEMCESEHCHCERGVLLSAIIHTLQIMIFILVISFGLNFIIEIVGKEALGELLLNRPIIGQLIAGVVGLVPNCASSVVITQLYLEGALGLGAMMAGLLVNAGVGLLILFRVNPHKADSLKILGLLYGIGVCAGILLDFLPLGL